MLGQTVAERLFGANSDPTGQTVRIQNVPFQVVGVAGRKGQSPGGSDYDDVVFIPVTTFLAKIQGGPAEVHPGHDHDRGRLRRPDDRSSATRWRRCCATATASPSAGEDDFSIKNLTETASRKEESTQALTLLLASIAAVSLLVGGIGIMNIMLVSVTERTREIGVRMAVGAKRRHILLQFLAEALALSVAGGLIGVALGVCWRPSGWRCASAGRC